MVQWYHNTFPPTEPIRFKAVLQCRITGLLATIGIKWQRAVDQRKKLYAVGIETRKGRAEWPCTRLGGGQSEYVYLILICRSIEDGSK